jgi:hypothetical protein
MPVERLRGLVRRIRLVVKRQAHGSALANSGADVGALGQAASSSGLTRSRTLGVGAGAPKVEDTPNER